MLTAPAWMRAAIARAVAMSRDQMLAERPYSVSLARVIASSSSTYG